jgi:hypothetical protein
MYIGLKHSSQDVLCAEVLTYFSAVRYLSKSHVYRVVVSAYHSEISTCSACTFLGLCPIAS